MELMLKFEMYLDEHEKFINMQAEYSRQLAEMEVSKKNEIEELNRSYETMMQNMTTHFEQVSMFSVFKTFSKYRYLRKVLFLNWYYSFR